MISTPDWVKDAVFYQIFPDRFDRDFDDRSAGPAGASVTYQEWGSPPTSNGFQGGNLAGIERRLDYLVDLGINAIYLNPIFASAANHRYIAHDYYQVDPLLGGNAAFDRFLANAHGRGIRVVLDGVFNHCSRGFYQFHHLLESGTESPYVNWFYVGEWPLNAYIPGEKPNYRAWCNLPPLPKFNTDTPAVRDFLMGVATHWLEKGIDGWRLDVPYEIDDDTFWREFRLRCKVVNPEAYIVGELWNSGQRWLSGDQFDAQMNYLFTRAIFGYLIGSELDQSQTTPMGYGRIRLLDGRHFAKELDNLFNHLYDAEIALAQLNMLGSHDTPRFMTLANEDPSTAALAFLCQMTVPGAPNIYYGDEIGMTGRTDPDCRRAFPWHQPDTWNTELLEEVRRLTGLRHRSPALRRGSFSIVHADSSLVVFQRHYAGDHVIVALNAAKENATFSPPETLADPLGEEAVGAAYGEVLRAGQMTTIPARSGRVWSTSQMRDCGF